MYPELAASPADGPADKTRGTDSVSWDGEEKGVERGGRRWGWLFTDLEEEGEAWGREWGEKKRLMYEGNSKRET